MRYGSDIPSYNKEDEARFMEANRDLPVTEKFMLGQIFECKAVSTLTPLHEYVYNKCFFRGANGAIESCAEAHPALHLADLGEEGPAGSSGKKFLKTSRLDSVPLPNRPKEIFRCHQ
ncbi:hypothetical protein PG997_006753 [Apiospora hydei]|uniref:Uncharacterized protein n=1 Tax=Apiospora hydei TaxID=1337664 RepID=A0ABR1WPT9_9PEZI